MSSNTKDRKSYKAVLKSTTAAGLAAVMMLTGAPVFVSNALAAPVSVEAPDMPSFAPVVEAVSPAVVSVRVETLVQPVADDGFSFNFGGPGFDNLPDDHPLKRFFREFGGPGGPGDRGHDGDQRREAKPNDRGEGRLRPTSQGSGFFISEDGYVVTNNHVVDGGAAFTLVMNDGTELKADLVGTDPRTDLAVLKVKDADRKFTYVQFGDDSKVQIGEWVVAVGNPFGLGGTVTAGIVSARGRDIGSGPYDDFIQVDAAVNRGNSGGPTFNLRGEVVGINTAIFSPSGGNVGIAFAIPANTAKGVVDTLIKDGKVSRGWLGVQIQPVTADIAESLGLSDAAGALVIEPQEGSPGLEAGIQKGDVVTAVNGEPVSDARDLAKKIGAIAPGTKTDITIWRDGKAKSLTLTVGTLPAVQQQAMLNNDQAPDGAPAATVSIDALGISVAPAKDGEGVEVTDVDRNSIAGDEGLRPGDKIVAVNNKGVSNAGDIEDVLKDAEDAGRTKALFQIETPRGTRFVPLPVDKG